jgi:signal transduction histidine kinase
VFGFVLLAAPALWARDSAAVVSLVAVATVWLTVSAADGLRINQTVVTVAEAAPIGTIVAVTLDSSLAVVGALAVPAFTASLRGGPRGMLLALYALLIPLVGVTAVLNGGMSTEQGVSTFTWVAMGVGLGLVGSFLRATLDGAGDPLTPYRHAQALLVELNDLSGSLRAGLDPVSLGATIGERVRDELPVSALAVHVPRGEGVSPLVADAGDHPAAVATFEILATQCSETRSVAREGSAFAFPLISGDKLVAVVSAQLTDGLHPDALRLEALLDTLASELEHTTVQLDTALLFASFRDAATTDERRRLAREMHDGVAQEIASIGYFVDGIAAGATSEAQAAQLQLLRDRITRVVAEVRRSVQSLRHQAGETESLGSAIARLARHLSDSSGIPILVSADERTARLRAEVEAELLRIAQEAMNNAVKHSGATSIVVRCSVDAPTAEIVIRDDGSGLGPRRADSHGLEIMQERARLVGAALSVDNGASGGTVVTVRVPAGSVPSGEIRHDERVPA